MATRRTSSPRATANRELRRHNLSTRSTPQPQRLRKRQRANYRQYMAGRSLPGSASKATRTLSMASQGSRGLTGRNYATRASISRAKYERSGGRVKVARRTVGGAFNKLHPRDARGRFRNK